MVACRYGISLLVFNSTSHSFAALARELLSQTLGEKFHIYARPCIILYLASMLINKPVIHPYVLTINITKQLRIRLSLFRSSLQTE